MTNINKNLAKTDYQGVGNAPLLESSRPPALGGQSVRSARSPAIGQAPPAVVTTSAPGQPRPTVSPNAQCGISENQSCPVLHVRGTTKKPASHKARIRAIIDEVDPFTWSSRDKAGLCPLCGEQKHPPLIRGTAIKTGIMACPLVRQDINALIDEQTREAANGADQGARITAGPNQNPARIVKRAAPGTGPVRPPYPGTETVTIRRANGTHRRR